MKDAKELLSLPHVDAMVERFLRYVRFDTQSDRKVTAIPSTPQQWDIARHLVEELKSIGIPGVELDEHCYLMARLPASPGLESRPCIGLMAHMDTAPDVTAAGVKPRVIAGYDGKPIRLSGSWILDPAESTELADHVGDTIIVSDGTTLLGADDKAGLAEIMTALAWLVAHPEVKHGPLEVYFTPDEETGKGMDQFPRAKAGAVACYTMDGSAAAEIEAECFTAYSVKAEFTGKAIHIGSARGKLANATSMAASFVSMLPRSESPEATDGWYGYYCPYEISGTLEHATVEVFLRDFTEAGMKARIAAVKSFAAAVEAQFPLGSVKLSFVQQYLNMKAKLDQHPDVLRKLEAAVRRAGAEPLMKPIRGGTDGSRLTEMGIPTPNVFTGGYNYHSRFEWASVSEMAMAVETILHLVALWAE